MESYVHSNFVYNYEIIQIINTVNNKNFHLSNILAIICKHVQTFTENKWKDNCKISFLNLHKARRSTENQAHHTHINLINSQVNVLLNKHSELTKLDT